MNIENVKRERVATEWDGCWFCDKCDQMEHWKKKAYVINNRHYCKECAEKILKNS